jgi:hypothetical protein
MASGRTTLSYHEEILYQLEPNGRGQIKVQMIDHDMI